MLSWLYLKGQIMKYITFNLKTIMKHTFPCTYFARTIVYTLNIHPNDHYK